MSDVISLPVQLAGFYKMEAFREDADGNEIPGSRRAAADWFPNLITNAGLEGMGTLSILELTAFCRVGTGTTAPAVTDTGLVAQIASTATLQSSSQTAQATPPYYGSYVITRRFAAGVAAGNLSEVGMASAATGGIMYSRALILDGGGNPTTITVLSNEVLDVTYQVRNYVPTEDGNWSATIATVAYSGIVRAADATSTPWAGVNHPAGRNSNWVPTTTVYNGAINAAITGNPSGSPATVPDANLAYVANSLSRDYTATMGLNDGNLAGGITAILLRTAYGPYQLSVSPAFPKDATKTATLTFRCGPWGRFTP